MLDTRVVEDHPSLCPAAYAIAETIAGSGVLCRVTGNAVLSGTDPSSLRAFCWCELAQGRGEGINGQAVEIGYQGCPVWQYRRDSELRQKMEFTAGTPQRVKDAWGDIGDGMINPA